MDLDEIEDMQRQINALSNQIQQSQTQLFQLQQKLDFVKAKKDSIENLSDKSKSESNISSNVKKRSYLINEHSALENFIGLKIINLVGIIVLLIGISIGVKYAIDKNLITPLARIILAYAAGAGLFILSLILRKNYEGFSAILFSGAMASAYFTTYGAYTYYNLFSQTYAL